MRTPIAKACWFVAGVAAICVAVLSFTGCIGPTRTPEQEAAIASVRTQLDDLAAKNVELVRQFQEAVAANATAVGLVKAELAKAEGAGLSATDALIYGAAGGTLGRTLLHGATRLLPLASAVPGLGWLGFLSPLLTLILQSESKKKGA